MPGPRILKTSGQTDRRILELSPKKFEEGFGFKPEDDIEQRYFANTGERLTDPEIRAKMEAIAAARGTAK